jgi:hypothetical protein
LEIRNDGDASDIERVLANPFVARFRSLNVIHPRERVFDRRPLAEAGPAVRLVLVRAQRLQQGFLGVNRD